jgi:hypothetical protein
VKRSSPLVLWLLLTACSGATLPPPTVVSVNPPQRQASSSGPVTVTIDAVLPTLVDYGTGAATVDDGVSVKIGPRTFGPSRWVDAGVVTEFLPSVLPEGSYDVTVQLGDGRLTTARDAFRLTAGDWPTGFIIELIPTQRSGVPFGVNIQAQGTSDGGWDGTVTLAVSGPGAHITPTISGPFVAGLRVEVITVTVDQPPQDVSLVVTDLKGHRGDSQPFHVR